MVKEIERLKVLSDRFQARTGANAMNIRSRINGVADFEAIRAHGSNGMHQGDRLWLPVIEGRV